MKSWNFSGNIWLYSKAFFCESASFAKFYRMFQINDLSHERIRTRNKGITTTQHNSERAKRRGPPAAGPGSEPRGSGFTDFMIISASTQHRRGTHGEKTRETLMIVEVSEVRIAPSAVADKRPTSSTRGNPHACRFGLGLRPLSPATVNGTYSTFPSLFILSYSWRHRVNKFNLKLKFVL